MKCECDGKHLMLIRSFFVKCIMCEASFGIFCVFMCSGVGVYKHACLCIDGCYITVTGWLYES